jgi:hypothetical protein
MSIATGPLTPKWVQSRLPARWSMRLPPDHTDSSASWAIPASSAWNICGARTSGARAA